MENYVSDDHKVEKALQLFPHFDTWNRKTITDCCRLSKIKVVPPDGIVLGSEESSGVHFIMEGTCKLIEHLSLVTRKGRNGRLKYTIFRDTNVDRQISADDGPKYSSLLFNIGRSVCLEHEEDVEFDESHHGSEDIAVSNGATCPNGGDATEGKTVPEEKANKSDPKPISRFYQFYRRMLPYMSGKNKTLLEESNRYESHFLQIALVHKGCCLGLGENLRNRYLVSVTKVTCMVIPLQFLLQHNPNNIWNRIKQFLNDYLPNEDKVLSEFVKNKKWNDCKRKLVASKSVMSSTKMSDVPISVRLSDANMRLDLFQRIFLQPP